MWQTSGIGLVRPWCLSVLGGAIRFLPWDAVETCLSSSGTAVVFAEEGWPTPLAAEENPGSLDRRDEQQVIWDSFRVSPSGLRNKNSVFLGWEGQMPQWSLMIPCTGRPQATVLPAGDSCCRLQTLRPDRRPGAAQTRLVGPDLLMQPPVWPRGRETREENAMCALVPVLPNLEACGSVWFRLGERTQHSKLFQLLCAEITRYT